MKTFEPVDHIKKARARKKDTQAFYTPLSLVKTMVETSRHWISARVLEPSAGDGRIVHALLEAGVASVDFCEVESEMAAACERYGGRLVGADFLRFDGGPYDLIVMNPPFTRCQDQKHIEHAYSLLRDGGQLVAVASYGLRDLLIDCKLSLPGCEHAVFEDLPEDTFKQSGTLVKTILVTIEKPLTSAERECEGFANWATYNAAVTVASDAECVKRFRSHAPSPENAKAFGSRLAGEWGTNYGVNWKQVADYLKPESPVWVKADVSLESSWREILGNSASDIPEPERHRRWDEWKALAAAKAPDQLSFWSDPSECRDCKHLDGDWCRLSELPVTVNPYLTLNMGMIGMACMGAGFAPAAPTEGRVP